MTGPDNGDVKGAAPESPRVSHARGSVTLPRRQEAFFNHATLTLVVATTLLSIAFAAGGQRIEAVSAAAFAVIGFTSWWFMRERRFKVALRTSAYGIWLITLSVSFAINGVRGPLWGGTAVIIMFAGLFAGRRPVIAMTAATLVALLILAYLDVEGSPVLHHVDSGPYLYAATHALIIVLAGLLGYYAAATRREQMDRVRTSEQKFAKAFRYSPEFVVIATLNEGRYIDVNEAFERITGYSRDEAIGRTSVEIGLWADPDDRRKLVEQMRQHGRVQNFECRFRKKSGEIIYCESSNETIEIEGTQCVLVIAQDVTQRKAAAEALRESEQRLRDLVETSSDWFWEQDAQFRFTVMSDEEDLYGKTRLRPGPTLGKTRWEIPIEGVSEAQWAAHRAVLERHEAFADFVYQRRDDTGVMRWLSISGTPIFGADGVFRGYRGTGRDITERLSLERQLRQAQKMEAIGLLAGGIAHDFNNILAAIRGGVQLAKSEISAGHAARNGLDTIEKSASRAVELVQQILAFSRGQDSANTAQDPAAAVREAVHVLRAALPATIDIRTEYKPDLPQVMTNAVSLHQLLMNLGINAAHAMDDGGRLDICLDAVEADQKLAGQVSGLKQGPYVRLTVRDTGCGMNAATLARIFEPFYSTKGAGEGTGLGLSVVYGIVKEHGGAVSVESTPGHGTEFCIYFPALANIAPVPGEPVHPPVDAKRGSGERLLFVDDEEDLIFVAQNLLQKMGYRVHACGSGEEAYAAFALDPDGFDAMITDLRMPGMSGLDLAEKIRTLRPGFPVIVMSGHVRDADTQRAHALGIGEIHWKPNTVIDLAETLRSRLVNAGV